MKITDLKPWLSLVNNQGRNVDQLWDAQDIVIVITTLNPQMIWLNKDNLNQAAQHLSIVSKQPKNKIKTILKIALETITDIHN